MLICITYMFRGSTAIISSQFFYLKLSCLRSEMSDRNQKYALTNTHVKPKTHQAFSKDPHVPAESGFLRSRILILVAQSYYL